MKDNEQYAYAVFAFMEIESQPRNHHLSPEDGPCSCSFVTPPFIVCSRANISREMCKVSKLNGHWKAGSFFMASYGGFYVFSVVFRLNTYLRGLLNKVVYSGMVDRALVFTVKEVIWWYCLLISTLIAVGVFQGKTGNYKWEDLILVPRILLLFECVWKWSIFKLSSKPTDSLGIK